MNEEETAKEMVRDLFVIGHVFEEDARECAGIACNYVIGSCPPDKVPYWTKVRELVKTVSIATA